MPPPIARITLEYRMLALTSLVAVLVIPSVGCQHAMTRVVVDDSAQSPSSASHKVETKPKRRKLADAEALAGVVKKEHAHTVALGAHRGSYADVDSREDRLSVLSFNMKHKDRPNELAVMADRLRSDVTETPDFVLLQEVVFNRSKRQGEDNTAAVLANELGFYCRGTKRTSDKEGVAILSRYPFAYYAERHLESQTSRMLLGFNRVSVMAEFQVPDVGRVRVVNVHFTNWGFESHIRTAQLRETLEWTAQRQKVSPADLIVFGGDFNIEPGWNELDLVHDQRVTGGIEYRSYNDPRTSTFGSAGDADKRLDYIFIAEPLRTAQLTHVNEKALWADGIDLVGTNDRLYLSDHLPVLHEYRIAPKVDAPALATAE